MKQTNSLNLVEALRGNSEKFSALLGLLSIGFLFLSIYLFGAQAKFSLFAFPLYFLTTALFLYTGRRIVSTNAWFGLLFVLLSALQELIALSGWIYILYLSQENPHERYSALANLPFTAFIWFFLIIFITSFATLMISLFSFRKKRTG